MTEPEDREYCHIKATEAEAGKRLDQVLAQRSSSFSRSQIRKLLDEHQIYQLKDQEVLYLKPSLKLVLGEEVLLSIPGAQPQKLAENSEISLDILYQDQDILVLNKQAGLVVHPQNFSSKDTLVNALLSRFGDGLPCPDQKGLMPGIVHRLDRETSGVMVCALSERALLELKRQFKEREIKKEYLAIVQGKVVKQEFSIESPLERDPQRPYAVRINNATGRSARTDCSVLRRFRAHTFLLVRPLSGRTHQIRVHLQSRGYPVVSDKLYSSSHPSEKFQEKVREELPTPPGRHALHASKLTFQHPTRAEELSFEAPLPRDLEEVLEVLASYPLRRNSA